ncbi:MAG: hypothetical protein IT210_14490 [Armatimonadetes bacterium]|nr:hypothetical protein [Armatimonadota bacterium]
MDWIEARHQGRGNLSYCDGHVKWNKIERINNYKGAGSGIYYPDGVDRPL